MHRNYHKGKITNATIRTPKEERRINKTENKKHIKRNSKSMRIKITFD